MGKLFLDWHLGNITFQLFLYFSPFIVELEKELELEKKQLEKKDDVQQCPRESPLKSNAMLTKTKKKKTFVFLNILFFASCSFLIPLRTSGISSNTKIAFMRWAMKNDIFKREKKRLNNIFCSGLSK